MKPNELESLIDDCLEGRLSEADAAKLSEHLEQYAEARARYWEMATIHGLLENSLQTASLRVITGQATPLAAKSMRRLQWRPLIAAAAGVVFGMLCTSVVFGFVAQRGFEKKTPLAIVQPGFEDATILLAKGFPDVSTHWGGDEARVVREEDGVQPKEGKFMLRIEPDVKGAPRAVYQVLDLTSMPPVAEGRMRQIEVSASFAAADASASVRYWIRAFAVAESREELDVAWIDRRDEALSSAAIGSDSVPGSREWQTFALRVQVPPTARSLVLFLGVRTPDKSQPRTANYLDEVQVSLIEPQPLP